ncbi:MAG: tetratricopeptide repeat protein [Methanothrix sp.]|jgi:tetratricopeptide (TPR) repeat protein|nr:tetratricopeptide repeat protein [Methanothrix sp.]MDD3710905.1 tetratricopeptide repeat protein [Methanothrix sp.]MDI9398165.1 tetratricopeptide repeat protein [Euryarchaeota archaeon]
MRPGALISPLPIDTSILRSIPISIPILIFAITIPTLAEDRPVADLLEEANRSLAEGSVADALESLNRSLDLDPNQSEAWLLWGEIALRNLSDREMAAESFDGALKIDPDNVPAWNNKGLAHPGVDRRGPRPPMIGEESKEVPS